MRRDRPTIGPLLATLLVGGALAIAALSCNPWVSINDLTFSCSTESDCLTGFECDAGVCSRIPEPDAGEDAGEPDAGVCDAGNPETCGDNFDNNCDMLTDCEDLACDALPCGANGRSCSGLSCKCMGNGGAAQFVESDCVDGKDNDCDGLVDCADPSCSSVSCGANGLTCSASTSTCTCSGNGGTAQAAENICGDTSDNDCDGQPDCSDTQCNGLACGANGRFCVSSTCTCSGNGGTAQANENICNDTRDNDCDGQIDCVDAQCNGLTCGANGRTCSGAACNCSGNGGTAQAAESICNDAHDNDCDGLTDCNDTATCNGLACGANGLVCSGTNCTCGGNGGAIEAAEQTCNDAKDNDCDSQVDCADAQCDGRVCGANKTCIGGACIGYAISASPQAFVDACSLAGFTRDLQNQDDDNTGLIPMPFAFTFFGNSAPNFWINTNGTVSFRPTTSTGNPGYPSTPNHCLPAGRGSTWRPAIYVLHEDIITGPEGVCWATMGAAPNRVLVVTWKDSHFCCSGVNGVSLTFSVFLRETTNIIDMVYPTMTGGGRANGSEALVGVQGPDGGLPGPFVQNSCDTANSIPAGTALRFTP